MNLRGPRSRPSPLEAVEALQGGLGFRASIKGCSDLRYCGVQGLKGLGFECIS